MTPADRELWVDSVTARYLDALDREDFDAQLQLWEIAGRHPDVEQAFHDLHESVIESEVVTTADTVAAAVAEHLPSAGVIAAETEPVTARMVADELFRHTPDRLPAAAHALNETLRASDEPVPADLGTFPLQEWFAARFGGAPDEYRRAFREAAMKVRIRANAEAEFQIAARRTKPANGGRP